MSLGNLIMQSSCSQLRTFACFPWVSCMSYLELY